MGKRKVSDVISEGSASTGHFSGSKTSKKVSFADSTSAEPITTETSQIVSVSNGVDDDHSDSRNDVLSDDDSNETPSQPHQKKQKNLSAQDIQVARETAELFKSNIFKLQIDELIKEVRLKDSHVVRIEKVLHKVHDLINQIPAIENLSLEEVEAHFSSKKVVVPFPDPKPTKANYKFAFSAPEDVSLVGSFGLKTGILNNTGMAIDVALSMPSALLQPKDYLNYRALYKRAFYVAYLVEHLIPLTKKNNLPVKISYHYLNDDVLCPAIKLTSIETDNPEDLSFHKTKFTINLIVGFPFGIFDTKKLLPFRNCIRVQSETDELPPTPLYNSSLLAATAYDYYLKYLYTSKKAAEGFKDACILGKIWLNQRGFGSSFNKGGFGHFEFAMLISALLHGGGVNANKILLHGFSSYQLFKGTIKYLATMDLSSGYLSFSSLIGENIESKFNSNEGFNVPTIFDKNIRLNILWKMTSHSYNELKGLATDTLELLNDVVRDRFDPILLQKSDVDFLRYDMVLNIDIPEELHKQFGPLEKITFLTFENFIKNKIYVVLSKALGDRAKQIHIKNQKVQSVFAISRRKPQPASSSIKVCLILNPDESEKLVIKGPDSKDEEEGAKFRTFWGPKAALRRFKDGTIQNCVVWQNPVDEPITLSIVKHVLDVHIHDGLSGNIVTDITAFNTLRIVPLLASGNSYSTTSLSSFTNLRNSYDQLSKALIKLDLPLNIKSLFPASPGLRNTSVLHPVPFAVSNPDFWNEVILQFESSSRWPDELSALEKTKTALLLKIVDMLHDATAYSAFLSKDDSIPYNEHVTVLNIVSPEGFGFTLRVLTERDELLYLRAVENADKQKGPVQDVYLRFNQKYLGIVKHSRTVSMLAHYYQFYSPTVRLFKRWLDSHMLLCHFNDQLVELIALKPFVDPAPYTAPHSVESGFLRILDFISTWNWKDDSLILDLVKNQAIAEDDSTLKLSDKLTIHACQVIEANFEKIRKNDPSGIKTQLFIGSKDDPSGILWSNELTLPIASRLTALARAAMDLVRAQGITKDNIDHLFSPVLKDYDFVIDLKTNKLAVSAGVLPKSTFKNLVSGPSSFPDDITTKYDITQALFEDLNKKFGNIIIFSSRKFNFFDQDGVNHIAGVFIPSNLSRKKFRLNSGTHIKPLENGEAVIDKDTIFNQIRLLGGDMVTDIKRNN